jgi:tetraacyldisaccharide 4'-kinase
MLSKCAKSALADLYAWIESFWYKNHYNGLIDRMVFLILLPCSFMYSLAFKFFKNLYLYGFKLAYKPTVPTWVIGNLTVGGNGKTILVMWLATHLQRKGYRVGIVSRGYGRNIPHPISVTQESQATEVGDEPLMLFEHCQCPVVVCKDRVRAIQRLSKQYPLDIILSDDGLQHFALKADRYIEVINAKRLYGNQYLLPLGPLREPISIQHKNIDARIYMNPEGSWVSLPQDKLQVTLSPDQFICLAQPSMQYTPQQLIQNTQTIHAVTGIAHSERFFNMLKSMGISCVCHAYPDHYQFTAEDFIQYSSDSMIVMTEKDAVKCKTFATNRFWALKLIAQPNTRLIEQLNLWVNVL